MPNAQAGCKKGQRSETRGVVRTERPQAFVRREQVDGPIDGGAAAGAGLSSPLRGRTCPAPKSATTIARRWSMGLILFGPRFAGTGRLELRPSDASAGPPGAGDAGEGLPSARDGPRCMLRAVQAAGPQTPLVTPPPARRRPPVRPAIRAAIPLVLGAAIALVPLRGTSSNAWLFFALFVTVIAGIITEPIAPAAIGLMGVLVAAATGLVRETPGSSASGRSAASRIRPSGSFSPPTC